MEAMANTATKAQRVEIFCPSIILSENFILIIGYPEIVTLVPSGRRERLSSIVL